MVAALGFVLCFKSTKGQNEHPIYTTQQKLQGRACIYCQEQNEGQRLILTGVHSSSCAIITCVQRRAWGRGYPNTTYCTSLASQTYYYVYTRITHYAIRAKCMYVWLARLTLPMQQDFSAIPVNDSVGTFSPERREG